jgi:hypothetical protein
MTSLPLEVDEVLEQEYEAVHGALGPTPGAEYRDGDITDLEWAKKILSACDLDGEPLAEINDVVGGDEVKLAKLAAWPALTQKGRDLMKLYEPGMAGAAVVRRRIVDEALSGTVRTLRDVRLGALYAKLHAKPDSEARAALCISGGGIRSATFALGIIQGLAGAGILERFHFLSTVSGGGYIGSWLSSWARRHARGIRGVQDDLVRADTGARQIAAGGGTQPLPDSKVDPEPRPLRHLRDYSNYLSPKLGFLSADTWTMASLYVRNLLLNLLVLIPVIAAVLALPRLYSNLLQKGSVKLDLWSVGLVTLLGLFVGFGYIGAARPVKHGRESWSWGINTNRWFAILCVAPLVVAGFGITLFWADIAPASGAVNLTTVKLPDGTWWWIAGCAAAMTLWPCLIYYWRYYFASFAERRQSAKREGNAAFFAKLGMETFAALVGLASAAALFFLLAMKLFPHPLQPVPDPTGLPLVSRVLVPLPMAELYVCFSVPLVLLVFFVQASIFVGLSSHFNEDNDREWWGRAGALLLMTAILGGGASFIAVFGPMLLYRAPVFLGSVGGLSGLAAGLLGYSAKTPANDKKEKSGKAAAMSGALSVLIVPLFAVILLAAISLGTTELLQLMWQDIKLDEVKTRAQFTSTVTQTSPGGSYTQKDETAKMPLASVEITRGVNHLKTVHDTKWRELLFIFGVALGAALLSLCIGVNRFSMHGLYRNRLIRAYLGASRYSRDPDRFTGFDENDNLQMYELRPELLWSSSFTDPCAFVAQIARNRTAGVEKRIWDELGKQLQHKIDETEAGQPYDGPLIVAVVQKLNLLMQTIDLQSGKDDGTSVQLLKRNRATAEATFPMLDPLAERRAPLHVINTALNLVSGDNLAWQQRKAESFTISPLHCGSLYVGYRDAREYGGNDGISLGTAVTISGAAASPNMGYNSSLPLAFILTLLNVRLGAWLGNPGLAGKRSYTKANPMGNLRTLAYEMSGSTNDQCPWIYLSDGGHFENLALYEMVLRRCRFIVVSDGGCDPKFSFDDLGNALRKIRTDLGVPIEIDGHQMFPRAEPGAPLRAGSYVATATIRYSAVDGNDSSKDGLLVYVKPSVYDEKDLPRDVYNYAQESETFPHESTSDQFFSESQFESYRALGRHVFDVICANGNPKPPYADLPAFANAMKLEPPPTPKPPTLLGRIEVTTTQGEDSVGYAVGDGVKISIRPSAT